MGVPASDWPRVTEELIAAHPLDPDAIVDVVLNAWKGIFASRLGKMGFRIGRDIFPQPQVMGFLLHELITLECAARYPGVWRGEISAAEKDLVYIPDDGFSTEIKTSSNPKRIFGNCSYAQRGLTSKKVKSGYFIAVNFDRFVVDSKSPPEIRLVRFGWIDDSDWIGQVAQSGQQAHLSAMTEASKLKTLYGP